jgi:hypothetical protein
MEEKEQHWQTRLSAQFETAKTRPAIAAASARARRSSRLARRAMSARALGSSVALQQPSSRFAGPRQDLGDRVWHPSGCRRLRSLRRQSSTLNQPSVRLKWPGGMPAPVARGAIAWTRPIEAPCRRRHHDARVVASFGRYAVYGRLAAGNGLHRK